MNQTAISNIADAIVSARKNHLPADASPFMDLLHSTDDAYAVQKLVLKKLQAADPALALAWKTGGPNRSSEQTHAALLNEGILKSGVNMSDWPLNIRIIEIEIALRLNRAITSEVAAVLTHETSKQLIDAMTVSIEVVDSRWKQAGAAQALLKLADMQTHGALVLGDWIPYRSSDHSRDWLKQNASVKIGDQPIAHFVGTHTLQDPTYVLPAWLKYACAEGHTIPAGTIVTTGSWCGMPFAKKGNLIVAEFDGIGKTTVQL